MLLKLVHSWQITFCIMFRITTTTTTTTTVSHKKKKKRTYKLKKATKTSFRVVSFFILGLCSSLLGYTILDNNNNSNLKASSSSLEMYGTILVNKLQNVPPFAVIGFLYSLVLHFGISAYNNEQRQQQLQQERVVIENALTNGNSSSNTAKTKKKRRRKGPPSSNKDTLMDGWTDMPKGPRPFLG
uniref:Transmembrane protein n=1 Tax=Helicotheca tamesis TaxID=374047 RepID=A0A7S2I928_9STRA|mmetsp:Transcript_657/g.845  ORF Transcript_657/g.845 Transcript_657/m.845 type:complete len:185 (+) Transcript_657:270-824(+)